jgi:hypothetical protein
MKMRRRRIHRAVIITGRSRSGVLFRPLMVLLLPYQHRKT